MSLSQRIMSYIRDNSNNLKTVLLRLSSLHNNPNNPNSPDSPDNPGEEEYVWTSIYDLKFFSVNNHLG